MARVDLLTHQLHACRMKNALKTSHVHSFKTTETGTDSYPNYMRRSPGDGGKTGTKTLKKNSNRQQVGRSTQSMAFKTVAMPCERGNKYVLPSKA